MGCICSKGISASEYGENHVRDKESKNSSKRLAASSRRDEVTVEVDNGGNDATSGLISTGPTDDENAGSTPPAWNEGKKGMVVVKPAKFHSERCATPNVGMSNGQPQMSSVFSISSGPSAIAGPQDATGWPSWLTAVAGEAIKGWVPRKADSFEKLDKIGQGTYSSVYRARDFETGKIVALKKVRFVNMDPESVRFMAREILILRCLNHPNVMKLEGLVISKVSGNLCLVFEYMEHDLAGLIASPTIKFSEPQIKCYMQQLFRGLEHCHSRGVLHRDIKGSNILIDNNGNLKIGDFGLATFFHSNPEQPLTSRVVTLWYRPPELLLGATDYGVAVDLWSAGCILAELYARKPIMPGRTEVEQLHRIFKLCGSPSDEYWEKTKLSHATIFKPQHQYKRCVAETFKDLPSSALALLDVLLQVEPEGRGSASSALHSEFFTSNPLPCDPSSLPKYPPSKELNVKLRDKQARRQRVAAGEGHAHDSNRKGSGESKGMPASDANAESQEFIYRQGQSNTKCNSQQYNREDFGGSGFPMEPSRGMPQDGLFHSDQLIQPSAFGSSVNEVGVQGSSRFDMSKETSGNPHWPEDRLNVRYNQLDDAGFSVNHEWSHHLLDVPRSCKDEPAPGNESMRVYAPKKNRIHYSGPLLPSGGNIEEMLKEHERKIQLAVRKAHLDSVKTKKMYGDNGQTHSLLHYG
ncbi:probable serine/threonine-protein kinase At1g09600 isoform X2 [Camellia sinensis]|uniref:probable serine/threonine-protein kinase At1g09600 isoform X2 n=1 Tax=Camellia sinensis TaxID=4442 RepID=UPI00103696A5|nr:probable serine/threonine-protein kinase At1g09600 isoform X2 [Camellia sinensis]